MISRLILPCLFFWACGSQPETAKIALPKYEVVERVEHLSMKINPAKGYFFGSIILPDSVVGNNGLEFAKVVVEIARRENMGLLSVYTSSRCYLMDDGKLEYDEKVMAECYVGHLDVSKRSAEWKKEMTPNDFVWNSGFWSQRK